jgi:lysozyme
MLAALEGRFVRGGVHRVYGGTKPHIGYGHRLAPSELPRHRRGIGEEEALSLLRSDAERASQAVRELVQVPLAQHEFDALAMLAYNIGIEGLRNTKLIARLNAGDRAGAAERWMDFTKVRDAATGELAESPTLQWRRKEECYLFRTGKYVELPPRNEAEEKQRS